MFLVTNLQSKFVISIMEGPFQFWNLNILVFSLFWFSDILQFFNGFHSDSLDLSFKITFSKFDDLFRGSVDIRLSVVSNRKGRIFIILDLVAFFTQVENISLGLILAIVIQESLNFLDFISDHSVDHVFEGKTWVLENLESNWVLFHWESRENFVVQVLLLQNLGESSQSFITIGSSNLFWVVKFIFVQFWGHCNNITGEEFVLKSGGFSFNGSFGVSTYVGDNKIKFVINERLLEEI